MAVRVAKAHAERARVDTTQAKQAQVQAASFIKSLAATVQTAKTRFDQAKAVAIKAFQEQRAAKQVEQQKATAAAQAAGCVKEIRAEEEKHARDQAKKRVMKLRR
jgi:hypothetical protein